MDAKVGVRNSFFISPLVPSLSTFGFIEDGIPSCATRFKQFCWISGTKPGVENRLHADHEMAKLDKAET